MAVRNLILVLGDQLDGHSAAFDDFDKDRDAVWMAEVAAEAEHVWSHKARIALFLAAMRHFRDGLRRREIAVHYRQLEDKENTGDFASELKAAVKKLSPERLLVVEPGEWRVEQLLKETADELGVVLEIRLDRHFLCTKEEFREHASGRKQLRMEYFYREMRKRYGVLMEGEEPTGGQWNYDSENRGSFSKEGPVDLPEEHAFTIDDTTREVLELVERRFAEHPGSLASFNWPVTSRQAKNALKEFIAHRLPKFGEYQDAMWQDEPFLYHAKLAVAMNLKLLDPQEVIAAAEEAYAAGDAPLNAVEGFVRQILGWREYVRGVYWLGMPQYLERNALRAQRSLPAFYWTGETEMNCLRQTIGQTLEHGYAHHIQRLMVTGLFALLWGVHPREVHKWYLAVYVDAVEWVELPNTLGMSQYADGGQMASKPYVASGNYIHKMSNYCGGCRFNPKEATGEEACPFTTLYWDFLERHQKTLAGNRRMSLQLKNLERKDAEQRKAIRSQASKLRKEWGGEE